MVTDSLVAICFPKELPGTEEMDGSKVVVSSVDLAALACARIAYTYRPRPAGRSLSSPAPKQAPPAPAPASPTDS